MIIYHLLNLLVYATQWQMMPGLHHLCYYLARRFIRLALFMKIGILVADDCLRALWSCTDMKSSNCTPAFTFNITLESLYGVLCLLLSLVCVSFGYIVVL